LTGADESLVRSTFTAQEGRVERFTVPVAAHLEQGRPARVLDVGCGTGAQLLHLAKTLPRIEGIGVDISDPSIAAATAAARRDGLSDRLRFVAKDYLTLAEGRFDAIISDSVLHNIPVSDDRLYAKLAADLAPGGRLFFTIPYDCLFNRLLWGVRRLLRLFRGHLLDRMVLTVGRLLHPDWPVAMLVERVPYIYMTPYRVDGAAMRQRMAGQGLQLDQAMTVPHASLGQARHRFLVYRQRDR